MTNRREFYTQTFALSVGMTGAVAGGAQAALKANPRAAAEADVGTLYPQIEELASRRGFPLSALEHDYNDPAEYRRAVKSKVLELFHYRPERVDPQPHTAMRWETDDYVGEKIEFNTTPRFRVPAYVLSPKRHSGRRPAVIDLHCHAGVFVFGKEKVMPVPTPHPALVDLQEQVYEGRSTSEELVKRGFVVISIDRFYFGERRTLFDDANSLGMDLAKYTKDEIREANRRSARGEATLAKSLFWAGSTWNGIAHWDDKRTIDYLITREDVDSNRIGCLGISMGGDRANFLCAIDDRIQCAVSVGWMATLKDLIRSHIDTHSFSHFLPGLTRFLDLPDVIGAMAPKPLLVQQCTRDGLYTLESMKKAVEKIGKIYSWAEAADHYQGTFYDTPHRFTREMQEDAFEWFEERL